MLVIFIEYFHAYLTFYYDVKSISLLSLFKNGGPLRMEFIGQRFHNQSIIFLLYFSLLEECDLLDNRNEHIQIIFCSLLWQFNKCLNDIMSSLCLNTSFAVVKLFISYSHLNTFLDSIHDDTLKLRMRS